MKDAFVIPEPIENIVAGYQAVTDDPNTQWAAEELVELADRFFASPQGAPRDDADHRGLLESILWYVTQYGPGDPLRWSPVRVEILLADWISRKVSASADYLAKTPDLLRAFIRFTHAEVGLRSGRVVPARRRSVAR